MDPAAIERQDFVSDISAINIHISVEINIGQFNQLHPPHLRSSRQRITDPNHPLPSIQLPDKPSMPSYKPAAHLAWTSPINPTGATPILTRAQIWKGLERKVRHAEEFVGGAISSTEVIEETEDEHGHDMVIRDVMFRVEEKKAREYCVFYPYMKVEFMQRDGTKVINTVSDGADGQLYMTYQFEWLYPDGADEAKRNELFDRYMVVARTAVEKSIEAIREMVKDGRIR